MTQIRRGECIECGKWGNVNILTNLCSDCADTMVKCNRKYQNLDGTIKTTCFLEEGHDKCHAGFLSNGTVIRWYENENNVWSDF